MARTVLRTRQRVFSAFTFLSPLVFGETIKHRRAVNDWDYWWLNRTDVTLMNLHSILGIFLDFGIERLSCPQYCLRDNVFSLTPVWAIAASKIRQIEVPWVPRKCEEAIRFLKSQINLEKIRTFRWTVICRLLLLTCMTHMITGSNVLCYIRSSYHRSISIY